MSNAALSSTCASMSADGRRHTQRMARWRRLPEADTNTNPGREGELWMPFLRTYVRTSNKGEPLSWLTS